MRRAGRGADLLIDSKQFRNVDVVKRILQTKRLLRLRQMYKIYLEIKIVEQNLIVVGNKRCKTRQIGAIEIAAVEFAKLRRANAAT